MEWLLVIAVNGQSIVIGKGKNIGAITGKDVLIQREAGAQQPENDCYKQEEKEDCRNRVDGNALPGEKGKHRKQANKGASFHNNQVGMCNS